MWRAPTSPSSVISSSKKRRDHSTGLPRRPSAAGTAISAPLSGAQRVDQAIDQGRSPPAACRRDRSRHRRLRPAPRRYRPSPSWRCRRQSPGWATKTTSRPFSSARTLVALVAGDDDHRLGARGQRLLGNDAAIRTSTGSVGLAASSPSRRWPRAPKPVIVVTGHQARQGPRGAEWTGRHFRCQPGFCRRHRRLGEGGCRRGAGRCRRCQRSVRRHAAGNAGLIDRLIDALAPDRGTLIAVPAYRRPTRQSGAVVAPVLRRIDELEGDVGPPHDRAARGGGH